MTELNRLTIAAASAGLAKGEFSARELTQSCVDAMDERSDLGAFITPTPDLALEAADQADAKRKGGEDAPLLGIPLGCLSAIRPNSLADRVTGIFSVGTIAVPSFLVSIWAILIFSH